ncbi:hypothetical protein [Rhizobium sp.]
MECQHARLATATVADKNISGGIQCMHMTGEAVLIQHVIFPLSC